MWTNFFLILVISNSLVLKTSGQANGLTPIVINKPSDCNKLTEYYDISHLSCVPCPSPESEPLDEFNCKCKKNFYFTMNNGGKSISCKECPNGQRQSIDGFRCVACTNCDICSDGYISDTNENGKLLNTGQCVKCDSDNSLATSSSCVSCKPFIFAETSDINAASCNVEDKKKFGGLIFVDFTNLEPNSDPNVEYVVFDTNSKPFSSLYYKSYLLATFRTCRLKNKRNMTSCQALVNMCAMNMYNFVSDGQSSSDFDVCEAYYELYSQEQTTSGLPMIEFSNYGSYKSNYELFGLNSFKLSINLNRNCKANTYEFFAAQYDLSGHLRSFDKFDISQLQLCNLVNSYSINNKIYPFSTTAYSHACKISVQTLLDTFKSKREDMIFYDLYLSLQNETNLAPIFATILNYKRQNVMTNQLGNENLHILNRRFFLVDTISSQVKPDDAPLYIRYAKSITLKINLLQDLGTSGEIYPPVFIINYDYISTTNRQAEVAVEFRVEYNMNITTYVTIMWIIFGSFCVLAFFWTLVRTWNWNRRAGKFAVDFITLYKYVMFLVGSVANAAFVTLIGFCIFWLIFYKGQTTALLFVPSKDQEKMFMILMIIAFVLKIVDVFYLVFLQTSFDVFFIDWEKPKIKANNRSDDFSKRIPKPPRPTSRLIGGKSTEEVSLGENVPNQTSKTQLLDMNHSDVSCWRTLFVANEWNELQTFRKTNQTFQIISLLFLLKFINLEAISLKTCDNNLNRDTNEYEPEYSGILRIGLASSLYIALELFQLIIYHVIYSRFIEDKITKFVDFCTLSNISMFVMTHCQYGYYVHGRSPHGNADTTMQHMTQALIKEELDLTTTRGLIEDHQTFSISVMNRLTKQYSRVVQPIYQSKLASIRAGNANRSSELEKRLIAYNQLNKFLIAFIDNILREINYVIIKRNFFENLFGIEFKEPIITGYFYRDEINCFTETIFFGKEMTLFIFELLLFVLVDYFAQNFVLAGFVLYIVVKFFKILRSDLGRSNIARKTLVDKRFLI